MSKKSIVGHMGCFGGDNSQALLHLEKAQKGKNNPYSKAYPNVQPNWKIPYWNTVYTKTAIQKGIMILACTNLNLLKEVSWIAMWLELRLHPEAVSERLKPWPLVS